MIEQQLADAWIDRDVSWLEFNRRVLQEAFDERNPLLERVKFLAIFSSNLDEFFMKRMAIRNPAPAELREMIVGMLEQQATCYTDVLRPQLADHGIFLRGWNELTDGQREEATEAFKHETLPVLTPLSLDAAHPFPYVSNLSTSWAFNLEDPVSSEEVIVRVKMPAEVPQWMPLRTDVAAGDRVFVGLDEVIRANAEQLFPGMVVLSASLFRVCRDADVELESEDDALSKRRMVEEEIRQRRFEPVVRLEVQPDADPAMVRELSDRFALTPGDVYEMRALLDYTTLFQIAGLDIPELRDTPWTPLAPIGLDAGQSDIFSAIRAADVLLHHPYDSFNASVERFISDAADDPQTISIKMTAYRVGDDTPFVRSLIRAAESGKQVACVIELNARFDEKRNIHWSRELEDVGAHVVFGVMGLKTHSKIALVVRKEDDGIRSYAHIATGNYHAGTAKLYEDLGLLTANPEITSDVVTLFNFLTGRSRTPQFSQLLAAPIHMRDRFTELIEAEIENHEAGRPARIICKMNQLEDTEMAELLSRASQAGVEIHLIVRGFCCLAPGVPGVTENLHVRSIIGRFLEHSRIFHFASGSDEPLEGTFLIGSADWMHRNLSNRVEAAVPVLDRRLRARLWEILEICLADRRTAWEMQPDGRYLRLQPGPVGDPGHEGVHATLMRLALERHSIDGGALRG